MIKNLKKEGEDTVTFTVGPTTVAYANAIRRIFTAYIPVVAFDIDSIKINSDTGLRKEYIEHRISMLPVDNSKINKADPKTITFELNVENKTFEMMDVLGKHLIANDKKIYFDPKFMLLQLQPGQKIHLTASLKLFERRTIANRNVALVTRKYDPSKPLGNGLYNFEFAVESYDSIPIDNLIKLGKTTFVKVLQEYLDQIDNDRIFQFDPKMHKVRIVTDDPHTIGNILTQDIETSASRATAGRLEKLLFCGYRQPHPTELICEIKIESENIDDSAHTEWMKSLIKESLKRLIGQSQ